MAHQHRWPLGLHTAQPDACVSQGCSIFHLLPESLQDAAGMEQAEAASPASGSLESPPVFELMFFLPYPQHVEDPGIEPTPQQRPKLMQ